MTLNEIDNAFTKANINFAYYNKELIGICMPYGFFCFIGVFDSGEAEVSILANKTCTLVPEGTDVAKLLAHVVDANLNTVDNLVIFIKRSLAMWRRF